MEVRKNALSEWPRVHGGKLEVLQKRENDCEALRSVYAGSRSEKAPRMTAQLFFDFIPAPLRAQFRLWNCRDVNGKKILQCAAKGCGCVYPVTSNEACPACGQRLSFVVQNYFSEEEMDE